MKNIVMAASILLICFSLSVRAGIPVAVDADPLRQVVWLEEAQRWMETAQHYKNQIQSYKDQLATQTGLRDIVGLVNQGKSLKSDILSLQNQGIGLNDLLTSDSAPSGALDSLYNKYKEYDVCDVQQAAAYINVCKQETVNKVWTLEQTADVQQKVSDALDEISGLTDRVASSQDAKESQDLANTIQMKQVQLNVLTSQWEMNVKAAEQRDKLLEQKRRKAFKEQQRNAPVPQY
ncbi:type IV secretion system protein [Dickeya oryzae]|uniref:type IV secretion system protein n=1 Tax=Dickeya oryzae TaxID=1240404 RepID=UPI001AECF217|nr:type IV secretion system protein [Dickeya oryzae]MBP2845815.1 type IV secretion system protein [Dickeya oryzae]